MPNISDGLTVETARFQGIPLEECIYSLRRNTAGNFVEREFHLLCDGTIYMMIRPLLRTLCLVYISKAPQTVKLEGYICLIYFQFVCKYAVEIDTICVRCLNMPLDIIFTVHNFVYFKQI